MGKQKPLRKMRLCFDEASLTDIRDLNGSFAQGKLRVMYTGENQNGSDFSQEVVERAFPSLANIPIVANYSIDENRIGAHDVELVRSDGGLRFRNLTEPCGVVPESVKASFVEAQDESGATHNYLQIEPVILWKRQEVYRHITEDLDGHVDHSMEVNIFAFHKDRGSDVLVVDEFEFEALCLLESARPCFEGSELELFSAGEFKAKMEQMMDELRETFSVKQSPGIQSPDAETEIDTNHINEEGGRVLDEKLALLEEYQMNAEALDFSLDDFSVEELREKFEAMKEELAGSAPSEPEAEPMVFELSGNLKKALCDALQEKKVEKPWGQECAYCFEDYDPDAQMVYAFCTETWNVFGFPYAMDGDMAVIDYEAGKRMKHAFVEYQEGGEEATPAEMFEAAEKKFIEESNLRQQENEAWQERFDTLQAAYDALKADTADIDELRRFRADTEAAAAEQARSDVFEKFEDLNGNEAFEALRADSADLGLDELEEKCYAIRGKIGTPAKFAVKEKTPKLRVATNDKAKDEPYGGLFLEFGKSGN